MTSPKVTRRQFAASLAAMSALVAAPRIARGETSAPKKHRTGPSKLVVVHLIGGSDDMYTCNPHRRADLKKGMGPGWDDAQLTTHGTIKLAPPWKPLEPYMSRMQVLLGVQSFSVAHETGYLQLVQMRTRIGDLTEPSFITLAGDAVAPNGLSPAITLDHPYYTSRGKLIADFHGKMLTELREIANDAVLYETAQTVLQRSIKTCSGSNCDSFKAIEALTTKLHGVPKVLPPERKVDPNEWPAGDRRRVLRRHTGIEFPWAELLLSKGMTSVIAMNPYGLFDTHVNNEMNGTANHQTALSLRELMDNLAKYPGQNGGATLLDETGFVLIGEMGRYPYINTNHGKDHFPQISVTLIGPGLKQGTFGETNRDMVGQKVSFATGKPGKDGALMTLDDVGRSLLEWVGHPSPESYGYDGRVLEFMFA